MKVLVTGANGMLGQDLCPILEKNGYTVIKTDIDNMDITNSAVVCEVLSKVKPDIVIHCAAYTNVDKAEEDIKTARLINSFGTENLARACADLGCTMVYVSTDYVFEGNGTKPYMPSDKTNPLNNYGLTKYEGEVAVRKHCKKYYITRTSWLYGVHGRNFVETMISLAGKPEVRVVNDQRGCPTWTVELCQAILKLIKENRPYGIYHTCGAGETTWYEFTKEIYKQCDLDVNLKPCTTDEFPRPARRPSYSVMDNGGLCRDWREALRDYIRVREGVCV